jgi:RimJ/RimL family protein N-acetyltransferase
MHLSTERLTLRPYQLTDAPALLAAKLASRKELKKWMPWAQEEPTLTTENGTITFFQHKIDTGTEWTLALFLHDGTFVGSSGFTLKDEEIPSYEIGYWLATPHTGQGYMAEAVMAQTTYLFETRKAGRVEIHCHANNFKSVSVARKLAFKREARLRNHRRHVDGKLADTLVFSHVPESWKAFLSLSR